MTLIPHHDPAGEHLPILLLKKKKNEETEASKVKEFIRMRTRVKFLA